MADIVALTPEVALAKQLNNMIDDDYNSDEKQYMLKAKNYYNNKNDILSKDFRQYVANGVTKVNENRSNMKLPHNFFETIVEQAVSYICGNPVTYMIEDKKVQDYLDQLLMFDFDDNVVKGERGARIQGRSFIHVYYDMEGEFNYTIINADQILPIYTDGFNKKLQEVIRYYKVNAIDEKGNKVLRTKVEWWNDKQVSYFIEDEKGDFTYQSSSAHWYTTIPNTPDSVEPHSWGKVPFIEISNNDNKTSDLKNIKPLIDAYDLTESEFINQIADVRELLIKVLGYSGSDAQEILQAFRSTGIVKIDDKDGDIDILKSEIPVEARKEALAGLRKNIFSMGMGVDTTSEQTYSTTLSGIALKMMYAPLELKCNPSIRKLKKALMNFMWFVIDNYNRITGSNINYKDIKLTVNKNLIINETEIIENLTKSKGIISDETILENHPYIENPTLELERMQKQEEEMINTMSSYDSNFTNQEEKKDKNTNQEGK